MANFRDTFYREKLIFIKDQFDVIKAVIDILSRTLWSTETAQTFN